MKYNEKMVLISNRSYEDLMRRCNNENSQKIHNNTITDKKKEEEKEKFQMENEKEEEGESKEEEEEKEVEDDTIPELPLPPIDFFQNEQRREKGKLIHTETLNGKGKGKKWRSYKKRESKPIHQRVSPKQKEEEEQKHQRRNYLKRNRNVLTKQWIKLK
jgi:hypothetical protein